MANWKLSGIVPDSDEEDEFDSQQNIPVADQDHEIRDEGIQPATMEGQVLEVEAGDKGQQIPDVQPTSAEEALSTRDKPTALRTSSPAPRVVVEIPCPPLEASSKSLVSSPDELLSFPAISVLREAYHDAQPKDAHLITDKPTTPDLLSTSRRAVVEIPVVSMNSDIQASLASSLDELYSLQAVLGLGTVPQEADSVNLPELDDVPPGEEEISRSFTRITSLNSSQLSSAPASQQALLPGRHGSKQLEQPAAEMILDVSSDIEKEPVLPRNRTFRVRKPIQLKPYAIENDKYRRTLKAGGLAPLRLASSQDDGRRKPRRSRSPDFSQQEDSQLSFTADYVDDAMDIDLDGPSSSPPAKGFPDAASMFARSDREDDEDLPNLEALIRNGKRLASKSKNRRAKSYSTKHRGYALPENQTQSRARDIFDVPASPPITSSPRPVNSRHVRSSISRLSSVSSTMQPANPPQLDTPASLRDRPELPTPVASVTRARLTTFLNELSSESEGEPLPSNTPETISSQTSDEDNAILKNSRRIRGVLPASHLRLAEKKKPASTMPGRQNSVSLSPVKGVARRGKAMPRFREEGSEEPDHENVLAFLSDEVDDEEEERGVQETNGQWIGLQPDIQTSRMGLAEEEDRVDTMYSSRKRPSSSSTKKPHRKRRVGGATASGMRQPRITESLRRGNQPIRRTKSAGQTRFSKKRSQKRSYSAFSKPSYPEIELLNLSGTHNESTLPRFIRTAVSTVRRRRDQGRQNPSHKFIRLATREDTHDAQSVLTDWRSGRINVRHKAPAPRPKSNQSGRALQQISDNRQSILPAIGTNISEIQDASAPDMPRKVHIRRGNQQPVNGASSRGSGTARRTNAHPRRSRATKSSTRPAQLETPETPKFLLDSGYHTTNFQSSTRLLSTLYKRNVSRPKLQANIQNDHFLDNEHVVQQSIEVDPIIISIDPDTSHESRPIKARGVRKRVPQRLDVGASKYRQLSNPLVVDYLITEEPLVTGNADIKLTGLAKFGTRYTVDFNIPPLRSGIFFHESTLLGQGLLKETLKDSVSIHNGHGRPRAFLRLGEKTFTWGEWDQAVSSELGLCYDWIIEQLPSSSTGAIPSDTDVVQILLSVLDYVRNHSVIAEESKQRDFLVRVIEVFGDFNFRLSNSQGLGSQHNAPILIDVLSVQMLLVTRLLRVARSNAVFATVLKIEDELKSLAGFFVKILSAQGFDSIRKLYERLQYLTYREEGIKKDQYVAQAWIVLIKTLAEAKMPRSSFWDIVSTQLLLEVKDVVDAQVLEKTWYCMFSLLPLFEFDELGFTSPGASQINSVEGWRLPQQLIKQITSLYQANQKQAPGFNDYCSSLFARCHHLVVRWGWWKSATIIGFLFDFFASQQLANLRNEVANDSPSFLRELDTNPSLDIEPDDRCFHIFLKIVALVIKHLASLNDIKGVRNLVARLLPNHDRQFSKNEEIRQKDIASLRNYHDLLCTMYWAAPVSERPAVPLLQDLVLSGQSHNEACLVNLRSWRNLARFVVATSFDVSTFEPLKKWQIKFFSGLCQQYLGQEDEVRQQAEAIQEAEGEPMTENRIETIVISNMKSTMVPLCVAIEAMGDVVESARSHVMLMQALTFDVLDMALSPTIYTRPQIAESLLSSCLRVLETYMNKIDEICPKTTAGADATTTFEDDSQDSYDSIDMADLAAGLDRLELASQLHQRVLDPLSVILRKALETLSEDLKEPMLLYRFVGCWARIVSLVTEKEEIQLESFILKDTYAVFENRESYKIANEYWPLFLARLLQNGKAIDDFKIPGFNIGLEWLLSLLKPQDLGEAEGKLSKELFSRAYYLCSHVDLHTSNRVYMINGAIRKMSSLLIEKTTTTELGISHQDAERLFSYMFKEMMRTMQRSIESLEPGTETHRKFVEMLHPVVADIKCYGSGIAPLTDFFVYPSKLYWPPDTDPTMLEAGIVSYCLRLGQPGKTLSGLFYFLHSAWQKALLSDTMPNYIHCIKKALKRHDFADFMLAEFLPAVISVGFSSDGWLLCSTFLAPLSKRVVPLLETFDNRSERAFEHLVNLLRLIMNGIILQHRKRGDVQPTNHGIIAVAMKIWFSICIPMRQYVERHPEQTATLVEVSDPLTHFIWHALQSFHSSEPEFWNPTGQIDVRKSKHFDEFVAVFESDIKDNWMFQDGSGEKVVVKSARSAERSKMQWFEWSLKEVLEGEMGMYRVLYPSEHEVRLDDGRSCFSKELLF